MLNIKLRLNYQIKILGKVSYKSTFIAFGGSCCGNYYIWIKFLTTSGTNDVFHQTKKKISKNLIWNIIHMSQSTSYFALQQRLGFLIFVRKDCNYNSTSFSFVPPAICLGITSGFPVISSKSLITLFILKTRSILGINFVNYPTEVSFFHPCMGERSWITFCWNTCLKVLMI